MEKGEIIKVSGPLVIAKGMPDAKMYDVVKVSKEKLVGEIIEINGEEISIQVYEDTSGIGPGEPVFTTGEPLSVMLAPGIVSSIYDGIQRPLKDIESKSGSFISRGIDVPGIDLNKKWNFVPKAKKGDKVTTGDVLGIVKETSLIDHKILVPANIDGIIKDIKKGEFKVADCIAIIADKDNKENKISMLQKWPIRIARPYQKKMVPNEPLITGQRIIDTLFPITKGGTSCIPGPFGSGKTVVQHQLAKWADADIIVFIGCGERGNEMTDVLQEFPELKDPKSGKPLMERTILIANTSNMPVAAREASIYTGVTIAEYFRDMGYKVALMADSTSRWAEALREMSGRLEEMPGEEGYPAYLGSRTASFYERAGYVKTLGSSDKEGSLTLVGAVSPPGGDLSEPVTQNTLRTVKVFWGLDSALAYKRHFPAINWLTSYSLYTDNVKDYLEKHIGPEWFEYRSKAMEILQKEESLQEIVRLVGLESLSANDQLTLETAKSIREDFLNQNAFDNDDTYTPLKKQSKMLEIILKLMQKRQSIIDTNKEIQIDQLFGQVTGSKMEKINEQISRMKLISPDKLEEFDKIISDIDKFTLV
jgi:V/A-type H+-transporting ATPase subunit A